MKADLYSEYQKLIDETNMSRHNGSRIKDLKKLRFMSIFKASELPHANRYNLRVLTNQQFHKSVVEIVYIDAVLDSNRQRRESRGFFESNIFTQGMNISCSPLVADNLVRALTPEKINSYLSKITGFGTEKVYTRDIIAQTRQEVERRQNRGASPHSIHEEVMESLRRLAEKGQLKVHQPQQEAIAEWCYNNQQQSAEQLHYLQTRERVGIERS